MTRFRIGLAVGMAVGYYLGAKAGRERYDQMNRALRKLRRSDAFEVAADKAKAVVDLGVERAKDVVEEKFKHGNGDDSGVYAGPPPAGGQRFN
ncbi:MAG: hypothetical protein QOG03_2568 [Actinomycetota bacterium]|nr:hypothetical protein [Actinomycetota bacterium]